MPSLCGQSPETPPRAAGSGSHGLVGESPQICAVRRLIDKAARNRDLPVLVLGETGTGKDLVARAIHRANPRGEFVVLDCGSLAPTVVESELFGHVKGAFTGATENKKGLVELADGGTAFFDEIGDLPLEMQVKLLRLVQEREFRPVGAPHWRTVDIRIIAATNRDLKTEVAAKRFREDLFHRLHVFPIKVAPLRERREDIPPLIDHFLEGILKGNGAASFRLSEEVRGLLMAYNWPGNVRELKHAIEGMAAMYSEGAQTLHLPSPLQQYRDATGLHTLSEAVEQEPAQSVWLAPRSPVISLPQSERQAIAAALAATNGGREKAARILKIGRTTLYRKMKQYGIGRTT